MFICPCPTVHFSPGLCHTIQVPWEAERPRGSAAIRNDSLPGMGRSRDS